MSLRRIGHLSDGALDETAARWFARVHSPNVTKIAAEEFQAWLAASPDNALAYARVQRFWDVSHRLIEELSPLDLAVGDRRRPHSFHHLLAKIAAAIVITAGLSATITWFVLSRSPAPPAPVPPLSAKALAEEAEYSTNGQNRSSIFLPDGSLVVLAVNSEIRLGYSASARAITLVHGRARFEVAKHQNRPFYVYAGDRRVIATGTAFDVQLVSPTKSVEVTLVEGSVIVDQPTVRVDSGTTRIRLDAGERLIARDGLPPQISPVNFDAIANWRTNRLVFSDAPLQAVVAALNRYGGPQILLDDEKLAGLRIDGTLRTDDPAAVAHAIAEIYSLRIVKENRQVVELAWK